jgi:hypothetical protein
VANWCHLIPETRIRSFVLPGSVKIIVDIQPINQEPIKVQSAVPFGRLAINDGGILILLTSIRRNIGKHILLNETSYTERSSLRIRLVSLFQEADNAIGNRV